MKTHLLPCANTQIKSQVGVKLHGCDLREPSFRPATVAEAVTSRPPQKKQGHLTSTPGFYMYAHTNLNTQMNITHTYIFKTLESSSSLCVRACNRCVLNYGVCCGELTCGASSARMTHVLTCAAAPGIVKQYFPTGPQTLPSSHGTSDLPDPHIT